MVTEEDEIEPLLPTQPDLRKPNPEIFSQEHIKKFEEASIALAEKYNTFYASEILDKIVMIFHELKRIELDQLELLKRDGEDSLIELTTLHKFIKHLRPGDENKMEVVIKSPSQIASEDLYLKNEYVIFKLLNFLRTLDNPQREARKRGGQEGATIIHRVVQDFARDMFIRYRRYFPSDNKTYQFINDLLAAVDYRVSIDAIKKLVDKKSLR